MGGSTSKLVHSHAWPGGLTAGRGTSAPPPGTSPRAPLGFLTAWLLDSEGAVPGARQELQGLPPPRLAVEQQCLCLIQLSWRVMETVQDLQAGTQPWSSRDLAATLVSHSGLPRGPGTGAWAPANAGGFASGLANQLLPKLKTTLFSVHMDVQQHTETRVTECFPGLS